MLLHLETHLPTQSEPEVTGGLSTAGIGGNGTNTTFINGGLGINLLGNGGTGGGPNRGAAGTGANSIWSLTTNMTGQNGTVGTQLYWNKPEVTQVQL